MNRAELRAKGRAQLGSSLFGGNWISSVLVVLVYTLVFSIASGTCIGYILLYGPITYALSKIYIMNKRNNCGFNVGDLFTYLGEDFKETFLLGLMETIYITLWGFLFVIPGIVKTCSYSMAFYIKTDHPEYNWKQCIEASKKMMDGHKMDYFILQLSFIGWIFVGTFACGVGTFWVESYINATNIEFYESIKGIMD